jgi:hypothetical protein
VPRAWPGQTLPRARVVELETPPVRCVVPDGVFDAFGWCRSDRLEWRRPSERWDAATPVDGSAPERMVFVFRGRCDFLPRELARFHAVGMGLEGEEALAPWAIDEATDGFFERRVAPGDVLWLAADNLNALFWGLHDWAHFHHHGPFEERAWTELQCDATALVWLWVNRDAVPLSEGAWERVRREAEALSQARFAADPPARGVPARAQAQAQAQAQQRTARDGAIGVESVERAVRSRLDPSSLRTMLALDPALDGPR